VSVISLERTYQQYLEMSQIPFLHCSACQGNHGFVRNFCDVCGAADLEWKIASGRGRIQAITVIHRAPLAELKSTVPYAIAIVRLEEGIAVMGRADLALALGDAVSGRPVEHYDGTQILYFDKQEK